ncbi:hypothetical protein GUITHDRAFT_131834 [Guillardia theta CCMP2712]|uniref:Mannosyltransferase n=1 Tax=Guillardia theta (strain CCMP2712) TaxID=905079 RepID=L1K3A7_GUITC|nr:hypothetical protein GUITHDRAFT_131834 [Guillardia theta CCMP2712]EKX54838.1 hypothetical protein GUITHDRAFT_131834 [Guillardia theta CCMP2712]|eukprot:XP_005841818.1 hypothetical protein GUITHDRAFT_131834 [Guillardia theta CCMP2712]
MASEVWDGERRKTEDVGAFSSSSYTYFVPDEYWQAPEVAHRMAYGYGYLTWEWRQGIRSYAMPFVMSLLYDIARALSLDNGDVLELIPKLWSGSIAILTDLAMVELARKLFGVEVAFNAILCQVSSCFFFYCMSRSLVNSVEACLITSILALWPWSGLKDKPAGSMVALSWLMAVCFLIRPTSVAMLLPLLCRGAVALRAAAARREVHRHLVGSITSFLIAAAVIIGIDSYFYGRFVLSAWNFFYFNAVQGGGSIYGSHVWWWYFSEGIPTLLMTSIPLVFYGMRKRFHRELLECVIVTTVMHRLYSRRRLSVFNDMLTWRLWLLASVGLLATNLAPALYLSLVHQRGVVDVVRWLRHDDVSHSHLLKMVLVLVRVLHRNISLTFLDCSPPPHRPSDPLDRSCLTSPELDEADRFFQSPQTFLECAFDGDRTARVLPSHIVMFANLEEQVEGFLTSHHYMLRKEIFHTHIPLEVRANSL